MPPMSPRTQALATPGMPGDQAKTLFEQGLSQMAYNVLINKLPNVAPDVVTFKILESDPEAGSGVGAFVVARRGQTIYVPVVMADNQVKPLDILYYKDLNVFVPLSKEWLEELDKLSLGDMGQGVKAPSTLSTDVDIRNTVIPPTTGRYSYASEIAGAGSFVNAARNQDEQPKLAFLDFLSKAPNHVKKAAERLFEENTRLLKTAASFYGIQPIIDALTPVAEKVADYGGKLSRSGALYIADKSTKPGDFKSVFGDKAPLAFQGVSLKGYFAKDDRKDVKQSVQIQRYMDIQEPKEAGIYRLHTTDGKEVLALVVPSARDLFDTDYKLTGKRVKKQRSNEPYGVSQTAPLSKAYGGMSELESNLSTASYSKYLGVTEDGKVIFTDAILGEHVPDGEATGALKKIFSEVTKAPRAGQIGMFVRHSGGAFTATKLVKIVSTATGSDGVRRTVVSGGYQEKTLTTDPNSALNQITSPKNSAVAYMPDSYTFLPVKGLLAKTDLLQDPRDFVLRATDALEKKGAERVVVKFASNRGWTFGDKVVYTDAEGDFVGALRKLATNAGIAVEDAAEALKTAQEMGRFEFWTVKVAGPDAPPKKKDPAGGGEGGDPAEDAMAQVAAAQMAPQAPSPVDMAVAEAMQNLMMQQQGLQQQMTMLQQIQQRTQMIAGGGGAMGSPAAAAAAMGGPMDPSMMGGGGPVMQAAPGGQPPMGGAPQMGQQPQGNAMQAMGGAQAGMSPMQGQGGDPTQQQPQEQAPGAMMAADDGSIDSILQQVNPQFMEQAGQLNDAGAFDAAALGSMAQAPALKDMVAGYLPNLEKSLDNVGRVLLTLWMDESAIKTDIGNETFIELEDNLRTTFKGLGELILRINQNAMVLRGPYEQAHKDF